MYVLGGARSSGGKRAGPTIYELNAHGEQRSAREIPRLVAAGVGITWARPSAVLFGVITAVLGLAGVILREQQRILTELTTRYAQDRILDVTCAVDLASFDEPEFHDRTARAQAGVMRAPQMVFGLQGLGRSMAGAIGASVALLAVA